MSAETSITPHPTELAVSGLTCNNCARKVTSLIQNFPNVASVHVALEQSRATIRWKPDTQPELPPLLTVLEQAGYAARVIEAGSTEPVAKLGGWALNLRLGIPVTLTLMLGEWVFRLGEARWFAWVGFALAGAVQLLCGAKFYRGAWAQLKARSSNMDTLVALGSTTAFAYSAWALLAGWPGHFYFMEAAAIITLISVGHWIEARVSDKAASSLKALMTLAPQTARKLVSEKAPAFTLGQPTPTPSKEGSLQPARPALFPSLGGVRGWFLQPPAALKEFEVPVAQLRIGDQVVLRPGDRVPVDGEVLEGESAVDEAMLTGESAPVDKTARSPLYTGTTNLNGRLVMRVTATGEATALAHIIAAVQRAQTSRANIQRLGDQVSNVFVPIVCVIAFATALWWGFAFEHAQQLKASLAPFLWHAHPPSSPLAAAVIAAAAVLIVACPCAMGLATPAAIMAAANAAARRGILIRDGVALEKAGLVTAVLFDKTGTLTVGKPVVVKSTCFASSFAPSDPHPTRAAIPPPHEPPEPPTPDPSQEGNSATERVRIRAPLLGGAGGGFKDTHRSFARAAILPLPAGEGRGEGERSQESESETMTLAAALAQNSTHPISQAIASAPLTRPSATLSPSDGERVGVRGRPDLAGWREVRGAGVEAKAQAADGEWRMTRLGSLRWLGESGVNLSGSEAFTQEWSAQGATLVGLASENTLLGLFAVQDALKPGAADVVRQLQTGGLKTFLITGDNAATAAGIAKRAGIPSDNVFAEVRPEQKAEFVKQLQARGERVAFVGDGINDAPALEQADLGIAVSRASDVAREAADIILLKSDLEAVPESLGLARAALRTIKQNLFWAFFYNAAAVPLAALGFMSPVLCAAAMGLSDLIVIGNALRLRRWKLNP